MDTKVDSIQTTEAMPSFHDSNSSGSSHSFPVKSLPSSDSDSENVETADSALGNNNSSSSGSGSEQGFHSGVEEFETASEKAFLVDAEEEIVEKEVSAEDVEFPFVDTVGEPIENSRPKIAMPIAKVLTDDEEMEAIESLQAGESNAQLMKENGGFNEEFEVDTPGKEGLVETNHENCSNLCLNGVASNEGTTLETKDVYLESDSPSDKEKGELFAERNTHEHDDGILAEEMNNGDDDSTVSTVSEEEMEITQFLAGSQENVGANSIGEPAESPQEVSTMPSMDENKFYESHESPAEKNAKSTQFLACEQENAGANLIVEPDSLENNLTESHKEASTMPFMDENKFSEVHEAPDEKNVIQGTVIDSNIENYQCKDISSVDNTLELTDASPNIIQEVRLERYEYSSDDNRQTENLIFGDTEIAEQLLGEMDQATDSGSHIGLEHFLDQIDGQIATDSDYEVETDDDGDGKELFDPNALAALLKAATGDGDGSITLTSQDGSRGFSLERPVGLGTSLRPLRSSQPVPASDDNLSEEEKRKLEKIQELRVKFLRLVHRLGYLPEDSIAQQVLYKMTMAAGRSSARYFSIETAKREALRLEREKADIDFSVNILVLGKTGVGKSATVNSIFAEERMPINSFVPATSTVNELVGDIGGVKIRVFDTPGLRSSLMEQGLNTRILSSVKRMTKNAPPDVVLYVERLDMHNRDFNDLLLLKNITSVLGSSIWRNAVVTLTHAASALPDGPSGSPLSYEVAVAQRAHIVQQAIGQAVGDLRLMNPSLMNPVTLVENHPLCEKNTDGQKVLPSGQSWRPQLLLLCYSMKILSDVTSLTGGQDVFDHRKLFGFRVRSLPLPYLLSGLLQSRNHPKLAADVGEGESDIDMDEFSASEEEDEEDEYDQLPPFKPLKKSQIAKLSKDQRNAYLDEYDYRVKLLQKKLWREEVSRMKESKKGRKEREETDFENEAPSAIPVALPDMALPPSFDGDNPAYRYRFLEPASQFLARPVLDTHGWDHDCGYDGVNLEQTLALVGRFPSSVSLQITKDKKEFHVQVDSSVSAKHGENGSSMAGFDIQNMGKQLAYVIRGETKFKSFGRNRTAAGGSVTFVGENIAPGLKIEDQISLGKRLVVTGSTGTVRSKGDVAYGANLEIRFRDADYPIGQEGSTLGLSMVKWRGDLAIGANLQSQFLVGRSSRMAVRAALNNKLSGQISVRTSSSEQLQIAVMGLLPIGMAIYKNFWAGVAESLSVY